MNRVREIIREHAKSLQSRASNREYRILDAMAGALLL